VTVEDWARVADLVNTAHGVTMQACQCGSKTATRQAYAVHIQMTRLKSELDDFACRAFRAHEDHLACALFYGGIERGEPLPRGTGVPAGAGNFTGWNARSGESAQAFRHRIVAEAFAAAGGRLEAGWRSYGF
jgi:hypothetical protein